MSAPSSASGPPSGETRLPLARRVLPASRVRFWGLLVPIHLGAFAALYFGTFALLERAYTQAASTAARFQLDEAVRDMPLLSPAEMTATGAKNPHTFAGTLAANHPIGLRPYRRDGTPPGSQNLSIDRAEQERVRQFLADESARSETWIETDAQSRQWVRGLVRLNAGVSCSRCHEAGSTRGAAAMRLDFTEPLREIRTLMRWRIGWLLAAWVTLIAAIWVAEKASIWSDVIAASSTAVSPLIWVRLNAAMSSASKPLTWAPLKAASWAALKTIWLVVRARIWVAASAVTCLVESAWSWVPARASIPVSVRALIWLKFSAAMSARVSDSSS